eukprot:TRINITY_DN19304_c0_g1_i1.p2 TRINITY_DN19304_c0_g1~~TRINITY_DN19304_c0_g1_i1.p2  ORF type:complete len:120 (+),score=1.63 TRINITY_DN19304_c0_g1_i1:1227-1586(+)
MWCVVQLFWVRLRQPPSPTSLCGARIFTFLCEQCIFASSAAQSARLLFKQDVWPVGMPMGLCVAHHLSPAPHSAPQQATLRQTNQGVHPSLPGGGNGVSYSTALPPLLLEESVPLGCTV